MDKELKRTLLDIATTTLHGLNDTVGPNKWDEVKDKDDAHGRCYDYEVYDHDSIVVIYPTCEAALQWCYKHLPEECPRWGAQGFAIERRYVGDILEGMKRDGLMSEDEYVDAMNHEQELQNAQAQNAYEDAMMYGEQGDYPEVY